MKHHEKIKAVPKRLQSMEKRIKQSLALVGILIMSLSLSGCEKLVEADVSAETKSTKQAISESTSPITSEETQYVAEIEQSQELTFDDINTIEINGQHVSLPFKVDELGEEYSIGDVQGFEEKIPAIYYNKQCLAVIEFNDDNYVTSIIFTSDSLKQHDIQIYGLSPNDNFEKIIDTIGVPNKQKELALIYEYENGKLYFGSENGTLGYNFLKISIY